MPAEQTEAIVLRIYPWSETSVIANLYTRDFGKISVLAKGARRPKSPFEAALDLLSICRVVFISKSTDALDILTEAKLQTRFRAGARDLLRLYVGYYVAELLDRMTEKDQRQQEVYDLAVATLTALHDRQMDVRAIVLRYEMQMLRMAGNLPSWTKCARCGNDFEPDGDWLLFSVISGGVLCHSCRAGAQQMIRLPVSARKVLQRCSDVQWQSMDLTDYNCKQSAALRGLVQRYLTVLLDRKLQMHGYIEELGR